MNSPITEIQSYIRILSRLDDDLPTLIPDGIYGEKTKEAVSLFQRKQLLPQTGKVDFNTWQALINEKEKAEVLLAPPLQTAPIKNESLPLKQGKESHLNSTVNLMLSRLGSFYENFSSAKPSETYTEVTARLISELQSISALEVTGKTDKETWNLLSQLYLLLYEDK